MDFILLAASLTGAVIAWLHTVFAGRYLVNQVDKEKYINLPAAGTLAALTTLVASLLIQQYTLIPALAGLISLIVLAGATDLHYRRIPNILTGYAAVYSAIVVPISVGYQYTQWWLPVLIGLAAAVGVGIVFLGLSLFTTSLGMGDVKYAPTLAFWVATFGVVYGLPGAAWLSGALVFVAWLFLSFLLSLTFTAARVLRKKNDGDPGVPFGIFMGVGAALILPALPYAVTLCGCAG